MKTVQKNIIITLNTLFILCATFMTHGVSAQDCIESELQLNANGLQVCIAPSVLENAQILRQDGVGLIWSENKSIFFSHDNASEWGLAPHELPALLENFKLNSTHHYLNMQTQHKIQQTLQGVLGDIESIEHSEIEFILIEGKNRAELLGYNKKYPRKLLRIVFNTHSKEDIIQWAARFKKHFS
jgi:hypothetical protein